MAQPRTIDADDVRETFSRALSDMYRKEVPQYGQLVDLVADINADVLAHDPDKSAAIARVEGVERLSVERHGAIRVGTQQELAQVGRVFAAMGLAPVGYYDLSVAGVPVHSTAFRPVSVAALRRNPFRVFTSLLRLELISDANLREEAVQILSRRRIFSDRALALADVFAAEGAFTADEAQEFVSEVIETFRWRREATVELETYRRLHAAHRLIADVVSFKGPHINHLTPRTLDIDVVQANMPDRGMTPKEVIEGPPRRSCPILLRQTSFRALVETISFRNADGSLSAGEHTARFGEVEQRGVALTRDGRALYDKLLARAGGDASSAKQSAYDVELEQQFEELPDDWEKLRAAGLAFFRYSPGTTRNARHGLGLSLDEQVRRGYLQADPITYEDFLPVSAAGIFQSNLGAGGTGKYAAHAARGAFEDALGASVQDEFDLYAAEQSASLASALRAIGATVGPTPLVAK